MGELCAPPVCFSFAGDSLALASPRLESAPLGAADEAAEVILGNPQPLGQVGFQLGVKILSGVNPGDTPRRESHGNLVDSQGIEAGERTVE